MAPRRPRRTLNRLAALCAVGNQRSPCAAGVTGFKTHDRDCVALTYARGQGGATCGAVAFAAFSLPIARFPSAEHLYWATGLAPSSYHSSTLQRRSQISREGLPEHRDALMNLAWGQSQHCAVFIK